MSENLDYAKESIAAAKTSLESGDVQAAQFFNDEAVHGLASAACPDDMNTTSKLAWVEGYEVGYDTATRAAFFLAQKTAAEAFSAGFDAGQACEGSASVPGEMIALDDPNHPGFQAGWNAAVEAGKPVVGKLVGEAFDTGVDAGHDAGYDAAYVQATLDISNTGEEDGSLTPQQAQQIRDAFLPDDFTGGEIGATTYNADGSVAFRTVTEEELLDALRAEFGSDDQ